MAGNGYIVKDFLRVFTPEGLEVRLVKVRNPWKQIGDPSFKGSSHGDWTGKYSKEDDSWTPFLKEKAKFDKLRPGEFYMTIEDFK